MRIAIASILQESNTFSPVATRYEDFSPVLGTDALKRHDGKLTEMGGFLDILRKSKADIVPLCAAWAITANRLDRLGFQRLSREFEKRLRDSAADALLMAMHGAQTAEGEDDVEGFLMLQARAILGPAKPIVLTLDLHANITERMIKATNAIVGLGEEWEEVTDREEELGYHYSAHCGDICYLAQQAERGDSFRLFRRRAVGRW